ncbi:MAG TPA: hypothetical protein VFT62_07900 [Mycobacteriales bacterium]|nr:hypothetical protein [Mycobacteriales bacterium]
MTVAPGVGVRCAVHPARLAADGCPVCGRPRCGADVASHGGSGCAACAGAAVGRPARSTLELAVRAGLAGIVVALAGGWVATQYVGVHVMSLVAPALIGLAAGAATAAVTGRPRPPATPGIVVLAIALGAAVLGTALGFRLTIGGGSPLHPAGDVGPPYLAALGGVLAWPVLFGPPRKSRRADQPDAGTVW